jgi:hypothetical protein
MSADTPNKPKRPVPKAGAEKPPTDAVLSQLDKFKQAARELGTDDDPEHFKQVVRRIARAPSAPGENTPNTTVKSSKEYNSSDL